MDTSLQTIPEKRIKPFPLSVVIGCDFIDAYGDRTFTFQLCRPKTAGDPKSIEAVAIVQYKGTIIENIHISSELEAKRTAIMRLFGKSLEKSTPKKFAGSGKYAGKTNKMDTDTQQNTTVPEDIYLSQEEWDRIDKTSKEFLREAQEVSMSYMVDPDNTVIAWGVASAEFSMEVNSSKDEEGTIWVRPVNHQKD